MLFLNWTKVKIIACSFTIYCQEILTTCESLCDGKASLLILLLQYIQEFKKVFYRYNDLKYTTSIRVTFVPYCLVLLTVNQITEKSLRLRSNTSLYANMEARLNLTGWVLNHVFISEGLINLRSLWVNLHLCSGPWSIAGSELNKRNLQSYQKGSQFENV